MPWFKAAALVSLAFFAPIKMLLIVAILLSLVDAVTGTLAARKRGEAITSAGFRRTVGKMLIYQIAIIAGYLIELLMSGALPVSKLTAGCIAVAEGKSCLENLDAINGTSVFKTIVDKIGSKNDRV